MYRSGADEYPVCVCVCAPIDDPSRKVRLISVTRNGVKIIRFVVHTTASDNNHRALRVKRIVKMSDFFYCSLVICTFPDQSVRILDTQLR